LMCGPWRKAA